MLVGVSPETAAEVSSRPAANIRRGHNLALPVLHDIAAAGCAFLCGSKFHRNGQEANHESFRWDFEA